MINPDGEHRKALANDPLQEPDEDSFLRDVNISRRLDHEIAFLERPNVE